MRNIMKGMIVFFTVIIIGLVGLLAYVLLANKEEGSWLSNSIGSFSTRSELVNTQETSLNDIDRLCLEGYGCSIVLLPSQTEGITVKEYIVGKAKKESFVGIDQSAGQMTIVADEREQGGGSFFGNYDRYFEVYLPESYRGIIDIATTSGDVDASISIQCEELVLTSTSGYVKFEDIEADQITITTTSGDIETGVLKGQIKVEATSGYLALKDCIGHTVVQTSSGDIEIQALTGLLEASASSGFIAVNEIEGGARVTTTSGDVQLEFYKLAADLDITTSSGYVGCTLPDDSQFQFTAETNSGDITSYFEQEVYYNKDGDQAKAKVGANPKQTVHITTSSGDITIED